MIDVNMFLI